MQKQKPTKQKRSTEREKYSWRNILCKQKMLPAVPQLERKQDLSIPTQDITITEALGKATTSWTAPKSFSSRAPSTNYLQHDFLPSMEGSSSERVKFPLALASLWEIRLLYNLVFQLWILSSYSPTFLAVFITLQLLTAHNESYSKLVLWHQ